MKEAKKQTSFVTEIEFDKEKKKKKCKERKAWTNRALERKWMQTTEDWGRRYLKRKENVLGETDKWH